MNGPSPSKAIANLILDWSDERGQKIGPTKLQKLLFFCHSDHLIRFGKPLVDENFEAWRHGPVVPSVFKAFRHLADKIITERATQFDPLSGEENIPMPQLSPEQLDCVSRSLDRYTPYSAGALSLLSHRRGGAWDEALKLFERKLEFNRRIPNDLIVLCYEVCEQPD